MRSSVDVPSMTHWMCTQLNSGFDTCYPACVQGVHLNIHGGVDVNLGEYVCRTFVCPQ